MKKGHIMLARKSFNHWMWEEERSLSKFEAWLDLLQLAAFVPYRRIVKGKVIELGRGELVASLRYLGTRWQWKKDKVSSYFGLLESDSMARRETRQGQTVITLLNFERYNRTPDSEPDRDGDKGQTVTRQRPDKGEEEEEVKGKLSTGEEFPSLADVLKTARSSAIGITEECATAFFDHQEAQGWVMANGNPIRDWRAALRRWSSNWKANDAERKSNRNPRGQTLNARPGHDERIALP